MAGEKSVRLFLLGDNRDVKAKLDEVDARVEELKREHPELSIGITTAGDAEKLALLRDEIKRTTNDIKTLKMQMAEVDFAKLGAGAGWLAGIMAAAGPGVQVVGTLAAGLVGVAGAGVSAGLGLGIFAAVAKQAYADVSVATTQYGVAMSQSGKARTAAMQKYQEELAALNPGQQAFAKGIISMKNEWDSFVQHNLSGVSSIMSQGIGLLGPLLKDAQPFLVGTEQALSGIFSALSKGEKSARFQQWIQDMSDGAGDAITSIAGILGHLGSIAGKVLEEFMPLGQEILSVIDAWLGKADKGTDNAIQKFLNWLTTNGPSAMGILKNLGTTIKNMGIAFGGMGHLDIGMFSAIASLLATISKNPIGAGALVGLLVLVKVAQMVGPIMKLVEAMKLLAEAEWLTEIASMALDAVPIVAVIAGIILIVILLITHWKTVKAVAADVFHFVLSVISDVWNWIKGHWPLLLTILLGPIGLAAAAIIQHWHSIQSGASNMLNAVIGFFRSLPGRILSAVGNLGSLLWNAGSSVISGLISGIESAVPGLHSALSWVSSLIPSWKGPPEKDATLLRPAGQLIMGGLVSGLKDGTPGLHSQLTATTNLIAGTNIGTVGASAGRGVLQVEWIGGSGADQQFISWLKEGIRFRGGDPEVLGR